MNKKTGLILALIAVAVVLYFLFSKKSTTVAGTTIPSGTLQTTGYTPAGGTGNVAPIAAGASSFTTAIARLFGAGSPSTVIATPTPTQEQAAAALGIPSQPGVDLGPTLAQLGAGPQIQTMPADIPTQLVGYDATDGLSLASPVYPTSDFSTSGDTGDLTDYEVWA